MTFLLCLLAELPVLLLGLLLLAADDGIATRRELRR